LSLSGRIAEEVVVLILWVFLVFGINHLVMVLVVPFNVSLSLSCAPPPVHVVSLDGMLTGLTRGGEVL